MSNTKNQTLPKKKSKSESKTKNLLSLPQYPHIPNFSKTEQKAEYPHPKRKE